MSALYLAVCKALTRKPATLRNDTSKKLTNETANKDTDFTKWLAFPCNDFDRSWYVSPIDYFILNKGLIPDGHAFDYFKLKGFDEIADHVLQNIKPKTDDRESLEEVGFLVFDKKPKPVDVITEFERQYDVQLDELGIPKSVGEEFVEKDADLKNDTSEELPIIESEPFANDSMDSEEVTALLLDYLDENNESLYDFKQYLENYLTEFDSPEDGLITDFCEENDISPEYLNEVLDNVPTARNDTTDLSGGKWITIGSEENGRRKIHLNKDGKIDKGLGNWAHGKSLSDAMDTVKAMNEAKLTPRQKLGRKIAAAGAAKFGGSEREYRNLGIKKGQADSFAAEYLKSGTMPSDLQAQEDDKKWHNLSHSDKVTMLVDKLGMDKKEAEKMANYTTTSPFRDDSKHLDETVIEPTQPQETKEPVIEPTATPAPTENDNDIIDVTGKSEKIPSEPAPAQSKDSNELTINDFKSMHTAKKVKGMPNTGGSRGSYFDVTNTKNGKVVRKFVMSPQTSDNAISQVFSDFKKYGGLEEHLKEPVPAQTVQQPPKKQNKLDSFKAALTKKKKS